MNQGNQPPGFSAQRNVPAVDYPLAPAAGEPPPPYTPRGQYSQPVQYSPDGQYLPPGHHHPQPSLPGQYVAPGQYPPPVAPGQYIPPNATGYYAPPVASVAQGQYLPSMEYQPTSTSQYGPLPSAAIIGPHGYDTVDSDSENRICTKNSNLPIQVKFTNRTNQKATIFWIDENGSYEKITSVKSNVSKDVDTWETHPFIAESKSEVVINGNIVFFPLKFPGGHGIVKAEITKGPKDLHSLRSTPSGHPVIVKFSNRTNVHVTLKWITVSGQPQNIKDIGPKKAWLCNSCDGHYFIASERGEDGDGMELNNGWFYLVKRGINPQSVTKVIINDAGDGNTSSSSEDVVDL